MDLPVETSSAWVVVLNGKVYVGGGNANQVESRFYLQIYTPGRNEWSPSMLAPVCFFGLAVLEQQLVLVGGQYLSKDQSVIYVWDPISGEWTTPYPEMSVARRSPTAIAYHQCLVVAGGKIGIMPVSTVAILDTQTRQWSTATSLPFGCDSLTPAIVGDTLFLLGGFSGPNTPNKHVFSTSMSGLVSHSASAVCSPPTISWDVQDTVLVSSSAACLSDSLLAVGGKGNKENSSAIHLFNRLTRQWGKVGDIPAALSKCSCTALPTGELLVLGGYDVSSKRSKTVFIGREFAWDLMLYIHVAVGTW